VRFGFLKWAWGELCAELSQQDLSRRQASSELSFVGAVELQNIVLGVPAVVATLRVGTAIESADGEETRDDAPNSIRESRTHTHTASAFSHTLPAVEPRRGGGNGHWVRWVLWIAHSVWRARVSSCSSNSTTSTVATPSYSLCARANDSQLVSQQRGRRGQRLGVR
jgi:hypothetical protein